MSADQDAVRWIALTREARYDADLQDVRRTARELFDAVNTCTSAQDIADCIAGCLIQERRAERQASEDDLRKSVSAAKRNTALAVVDELRRALDLAENKARL